MHLLHRLFLGRPATIIPLETTTPAGYMQMTAEQTESWTQSANAYVADEEESLFSVRTSGELLLAELLQQFDDKAGAALLEAIRQRLQEADAAKVGLNADSQTGAARVALDYVLPQQIDDNAVQAAAEGHLATLPGGCQVGLQSTWSHRG